MVITKSKLVFLLIILIAIFLRLWQLDSIPPGLYHDEAINGNDALASLKTGDFKLFYPENNGREGLFIWLISISFSIFGISIWSLRIVPAIIGILTVSGLYLLTKELFRTISDKFKAESIALLSSFFLAISFWHINFSRIVFRGILVPFLLVFSTYFLIKGFRSQKKINFVIAGIFFGLGFYTYIAFRLAVILLAIIFFLWWLIYRKQNLEKKFFKFSALSILFIILVSLSIGIYFVNNPQDFLGRASQTSIFSQPNILKASLKSSILHLAMFNFFGDWNWRHNFAGSPQLFWVIGIFFLAGIITSIRELKKSIINKDHSLFTVYSLLIAWFFVMLLPGILTIESIPHALRAIGTIPVVYILAGLGAWKIYQWIRSIGENWSESFKKLLIFSSIIFLLLIAVSQFNKYFILWSTHPETKNAFSKDHVEIGNYLNSLPEDIQKVVIVNRSGVPVPFPDGVPMPAQTIMFIENMEYGKTRSLYLLPGDIDKVKINKGSIIIPLQYDKDLFQKLETMFPQGETKRENGILMYKI
ncbi:MAG: glycosyltransferase family 39 protein [Patescibacteria group bacterium]|nr:glycosyltransferase family 39 protein [Patescibacteria group bacterium]